MLLTRRGMGDTSTAGLADQVNTCVAAGGTEADCIAAVFAVNTPAGLPSWVLPVGLGVVGLLLLKAMSR